MARLHLTLESDLSKLIANLNAFPRSLIFEWCRYFETFVQTRFWIRFDGKYEKMNFLCQRTAYTNISGCFGEFLHYKNQNKTRIMVMMPLYGQNKFSTNTKTQHHTASHRMNRWLSCTKWCEKRKKKVRWSIWLIRQATFDLTSTWEVVEKKPKYISIYFNCLLLVIQYRKLESFTTIIAVVAWFESVRIVLRFRGRTLERCTNTQS